MSQLADKGNGGTGQGSLIGPPRTSGPLVAAGDFNWFSTGRVNGRVAWNKAGNVRVT